MTNTPEPDAIFRDARAAQSDWADRTVTRRLRVIRRLRHRLADSTDDLVRAMDQHKDRDPGETLSAEILPVLEACRFLEKRAADILETRRPGAYSYFCPFIGLRHEIRREPFGVLLVIAPSNYPFMLPAVQALQALTAGNAVMVKPGNGGSGACRLLGDMLEDAGLPPDLYHVAGEGPEEGQRMLNAGPDKVVFTGSASVGRKVLRTLADCGTPATLELSGNDAVFVLDDADLDLVVRALRFGLTLNNGETCISPRRLFATPQTADELEQQLGESTDALPRCRAPEGPLRHARELIDEAVEEGASLLTRAPKPGKSCRPAIVTDASPDMRLLQEDVFAPVLSIIRVANQQEALEADAQCPYALGATVFGPEQEALALARRVDAGAVVVNDMIAPTADPRMPFGGRKKSGYGVTRGAEGLLEMTRPKAIAISRSRVKPHLSGASEEVSDILHSYIRAAHGRGLERLKSAFDLVRKALKNF